MARQVQISVYRFSELSAKAKERVKRDHDEAFGFAWQSEYMDSLKALAKHFGGRLGRYAIDFSDVNRSHASFDMPEELDEDDIRERLGKLGSYDPKTLKGHGDCKLTGFCADEDAIDGFRAAFLAGERDLGELMQAAYRTWLDAAIADYASEYEDEHFADTADANNYEYTEDGKLWQGKK